MTDKDDAVKWAQGVSIDFSYPLAVMYQTLVNKREELSNFVQDLAVMHDFVKFNQLVAETQALIRTIDVLEGKEQNVYGLHPEMLELDLSDDEKEKMTPEQKAAAIQVRISDQDKRVPRFKTAREIAEKLAPREPLKVINGSEA